MASVAHPTGNRDMMAGTDRSGNVMGILYGAASGGLVGIVIGVVIGAWLW